MNDSSYSAIDQEPNGRPIGPAGTPASATATVPGRATNGARGQVSSQADDLARARMDDEGAAQAHPRSPRPEGFFRSLWSRILR